jgi:putative FmdB family regulatory protein
MPVYEYYCRTCDGIFEALRPMSRSSGPAPCPVCENDGQRMMPTSFAAFTFRDGYPRKLPDKGTYWHLGQEVKQRVSGPIKPWHHPEIDKPAPPPRKSKGDAAVEREKKRLRRKELDKMRASGVQPSDRYLPKKLRQG